MSDDLRKRLREAADLHDKLAASHPKLSRGQVWCRSCGHSQKVDSAYAMRSGWPKCCGFTMTIDGPADAILSLPADEGDAG